MPFISYAQNYEDVMLWRALRHVERGFYIDVGAQSSELDSVTRAFSERGWRGINVEPHPLYFAQLSERRPLDVNLSVAVGESVGTLTMNFVEDTGLSTADDGIAKRHAAAGYVVRSNEVQMTTLSSIWLEHLPTSQQVHFLKVDVEGFERAVLAGNDWQRNRPWVAVVEATQPNSQIESYSEWESILLLADYLFVYADGLNRYYVAREHPELVGAFKYPPNVFDDFVDVKSIDNASRAERAEGEVNAMRHASAQLEVALNVAKERAESSDRSLVESQQRLEAARLRLDEELRRLDEVQQCLDITERRLAFADRSLVESQRRIEAAELGLIGSRRREHEQRDLAEAQVKALRHEVAVRDQMVADANHRAAIAAHLHDEILRSRSWRMTGPVRKMVSMIPRPVWRQARRAAKAAWWALTPWRIPERLRFIRDRDRAAESTPATHQDVSNAEIGRISNDALVTPRQTPSDALLWECQDQSAIIDKWSAARWCIDLLRTRPDLRSRFPRALSEGGEGAFAHWLAEAGGPQLGLSVAARRHLGELLESDLGANARQYFLFRSDVRVNLPHGLTPAGQAELFRWFMQNGNAEGGLRSEEVLWLFLEAAENPPLELVRAYRFTAAWQRQFPDGLTAFGHTAFAAWFSATYGVSGDWVDPKAWPVAISPSRQIRQSYHARIEWREQHPEAFDSAARATALLTWLQSESSGISDDARAWCAALDHDKVGGELVAGGVNLIGHFCCPSGVRVSAEALARGMEELGIETSLRDLRTDVKDEPNHVSFDGMEDFDATIIHTQPEPFFDEAYSRSDLAERQPRTYRIAYWYWEFDSIPESWLTQAAKVDEVWAATEFVAKGLRDRLSIPVRTMFPGVQLGAYKVRDRRYFGLQDGKFTFLFNFHMNSVMERKNPLGLINAFKAAFRPDEPVALVLKTMFGHHHPAQIQQLQEAAAGCNVTVIDKTYSSDEVLSLLEVCDAYVSLHRSEGLGLTMAEAMLMGKPVIATNYSGNVDFMDDANSLLVPYELVKLGHPMPPYDSELLWAEPSLECAAASMRRLFEAPDWARELGEKGRASAQARLSVRSAGIKVAHRLSEIRAVRGGDGQVYG